MNQPPVLSDAADVIAARERDQYAVLAIFNGFAEHLRGAVLMTHAACLPGPSGAPETRNVEAVRRQLIEMEAALAAHVRLLRDRFETPVPRREPRPADPVVEAPAADHSPTIH